MVKKDSAQLNDYEVDLMGYVKVLLREKRLILGVFLGAVAVAVGVSLLLPDIYRATASIEMGRLGSGEGSILVEDPVQLMAKISGGVFEPQIVEDLGIEKDALPKIGVSVPKGTILINITSESTDPQQAKNVLEKLVSLILSDHWGSIKVKKEVLEEDIKRLQNKISSLEREKKNFEAKVKTLQKTPPPQQSTGSQFALLDAKEQLEVTKQNIEDLYLRVNSSRRVLDDIRPTKVIAGPAVDNGPISPRPLLNVAIASVLGFFLGVLLAFTKEWWQESFR
ncbi:MAG: hypothetical protein BMS9Abin34_389 [Patescibacteria group bacterium]|nr:MAG: hypothetical protein BMS9Abin34_389 [Patescibacteria group bacterium]